MKLHQWISIFALLFIGFAQYSQQSYASQASSAVSLNANTAFLQAEQSAGAMLNINKASAQELSSLPGIGIKKAEAIVAYRELNGKFLSTEELVNVKGIGPKMLAKMTGKISV